jgi:hypothetical protein
MVVVVVVDLLPLWSHSALRTCTYGVLNFRSGRICDSRIANMQAERSEKAKAARGGNRTAFGSQKTANGVETVDRVPLRIERGSPARYKRGSVRILPR